MKPSLLTSLLRRLSPNIVQTPLTGYIGIVPDIGALQTNLGLLALNGQSAAGGVNFSTSAAASLTLTQLGNVVQRFTVGSAMTLTLDSAYNIAKFLPLPLAML